MNTITVSESLAVEVIAGADPHVIIDRADGGAIRVEPHELRGLVAALVEAAGRLAAGAAIGLRKRTYP